MRVGRIDQNSATPIDAFQRFRHVHPRCSENNDVALGRLLPGPRDGAWTKISDEISQCLRTSGIGYNYGMTSGYQMAAERARYVTGTYKPTFMTNLLSGSSVSRASESRNTVTHVSPLPHRTLIGDVGQGTSDSRFCVQYEEGGFSCAELPSSARFIAVIPPACTECSGVPRKEGSEVARAFAFRVFTGGGEGVPPPLQMRETRIISAQGPLAAEARFPLRRVSSCF